MALILTPEVRDRIDRVVEYADQNRLNLHTMTRKVSDKTIPPVGDNPNHVCKVPLGYVCVFSIEQHPGNWYRHLSISVSGRMISPLAANAIMGAFGFINKQNPKSEPTLMDVDHAYKEEISNDNVAINLLQKL